MSIGFLAVLVFVATILFGHSYWLPHIERSELLSFDHFPVADAPPQLYVACFGNRSEYIFQRIFVSPTAPH
ncbi:MULTISPECIES: hypothetical protein [unclassified Caballeronia]|uniref:hypothetical protein n=1 Tax=unclassified Caballeronia TaxID=2646786 RepID=UPI003ED12E93